MERKYIKDLVEWNNRKNRKPLLIWGARQVGKTYLLKNIFAERYYRDNYVYIDCRTDYKFTNYCMEHVNAEDVLRFISIEHDVKINEKTLIIFDEAQECPSIITLMKYFCQDHKEIPIIVTGSMVRMRIKRIVKKRGVGKEDFLFPIGKIDQLTIYPMTFDEYLYNRNNSLYEMIKSSYEEKTVLEKEYHELSLDIFYEYVLIGGMPEAVNTFLETKDFNESRRVLKDLYDNYLSDMELYQASQESVLRSKSIFSQIYSQLNSGSKNFKSSSIGNNIRNRDLMNPMDWLTEAQLIKRSYQKTDHVTLPLIKEDNSPYRIYLCDMGMFTYQSGINSTSFIDKNGHNMLSGIFFENYTAIELSSRGIGLFFWNGKNDSEFEFIIQQSNDVIPMDVKKNRGSLNSLEKFKEHNPYNYSIKVSSNNYGFDKERRILTIPFYKFTFLANDLKNNSLSVECCP